MKEQNRREKFFDGLRNSLWGLGIIAAVLGARSLGAFHALELMALDSFLTLNNQLLRETEDPDITIVQIDPPYVNGSEEKGYTIQPDSLANILEKILANEPTVVGTDIVSYRIIDGDDKSLLSVIERHPNVITVANYSANPAPPIEGLQPGQLVDQVGFNDLLLDRDGTVRRALLDFFLNPGSIDSYRRSFAIQVVNGHFQNKTEDSRDQFIELENGIEDEATMRFGSVEIPRITTDDYGYTEQQIYGVQTLINYRNSAKPFSVVRASDLLESQAERDKFIKDKIVILGLAGLAQDLVIPSSKVNSVLEDSRQVSGIEIQAHIISQIVQAVDAGRPLIRTNQTIQYIFLIIVSALGISSGRYSKDTPSSFLSLLATITGSILLSYFVLVEIGLWLPISATLVSTTATGLVYINYAQNKRRWLKLINQLDSALENERQLSEKLVLERKKTIEHVFDSIHNGPLQTLANLLRRTRDEAIELSEVCFGLENLNREIRYIGDSIRQDATDQKHSLDVSYAGTKFDLDIPLQELFQEVYDAMLSRPLLGFSDLKFTIISFDPIESEMLTIEVKRKLCRFLEEALANVGKHAIGATRLVVTGKNKDNRYELTVADNGPGIKSDDLGSGEGTRIGKEVEKITKGKFIHKANKPKGFFCQLIFPIFI